MAKVLVAEDLEELRRLIVSVLELEEHEVTSVENGLEAMEALKSVEVELLITDLIMPEMDGLKLIEWTREHYKDLRIIAISGGKAVIPGVYLKAARDAGANAVLPKPFGNKDLLETVKEVLSGEAQPSS